MATPIYDFFRAEIAASSEADRREFDELMGITSPAAGDVQDSPRSDSGRISMMVDTYANESGTTWSAMQRESGIVVDTFVGEPATTWVASQRGSDESARSIRPAAPQDNSAGVAEATESLRRMLYRGE